MRCRRGTYEIVFTPHPTATSGSFNVQAWESSRVTGTLTVGTANTYTSTLPGQVVQKTFTAPPVSSVGSRCRALPPR